MNGYLDCNLTIEPLHLQAALAVWRYCEESALSIFDSDNLAFQYRDVIRQQPGIKRRELRLSKSHKITTKRFEAAIEWLKQRGDIIITELDKGKAECYYPAPLLSIKDSSTESHMETKMFPSSPVPPTTQVEEPIISTYNPVTISDAYGGNDIANRESIDYMALDPVEEGWVGDICERIRIPYAYKA